MTKVVLGMIDGLHVRIRFTQDFRGGANAETLATRGKEMAAICSCPPPGYRGWAGYTIARPYGRTWIIPEAYAEIIAITERGAKP